MGLEEAKQTVIKETQIEKDMAEFTAKKTIAMYNNGLKEQECEAIASVEEMATIRSLELKKALVERNLQLDAQASNLTMDYRMKQAQTELAQKQYAFQQQYVQAENKLAQQYNAAAAAANC